MRIRESSIVRHKHRQPNSFAHCGWLFVTGPEEDTSYFACNSFMTYE